MKEWKVVTLIVCGFVLLRELRPVEPFFTSYLTSPPTNFTTEQVNEIIYPMGTYASLSLVVVIFLITDYFRYKPIIILDGITGILTYLLLFGKPTIPLLLVEQWFYGFFFSSDVACNTYLYAKIEDTSKYQRITGYIRASSLIGRFISGVTAQISISYNLLSKSDLVYVSTAGMTLTTLWAFFIPSVGHSIYFHRVERTIIKDKVKPAPKVDTEYNFATEDSEKENVKLVVKSQPLKMVLKRLWNDFKAAYTNEYVTKWSAWWAFALCGFYFVNTYSQVLWQTVADDFGDNTVLMNGAVDSIYTISSAAASYFISKLDFKWNIFGDWVLTFTSFLMAVLVVHCYFANSLWLIYASYILYGMIFQTMLTIAESEVARHLEKDSYALIFGFNSFMALGLGSILTYTVIEGNLIYFTMRQQFLFYGGYYCLLGSVFLIKAIRSLI